VVGARAIEAEDFLRHLAADDLRGRAAPKRPAFATDLPLDPYSVGQWMREFGLDASDLPVPRAPAGLRPVPREPIERDEPRPEPVAGLAEDRLDAELWAAGLDAVDIDMERWLRLMPPPTSPRPSPDAGPRRRSR
jgi:hypothetical protein